MSRPLSLLDGRWAFEWADLAPGQHASHRATTSSRTPGKVNRGTVYRRSFQHPPLHLCKCGQSQEQCVACGTWFCEATGHQKHSCESKGATP